jgi:hypothetical protein
MKEGLYFLGKCINIDCRFFRRATLMYIGLEGRYDIYKEMKLCKCGGCRKDLSTIQNIVLAHCSWRYRGRTQNGAKLTVHKHYNVRDVEAINIIKDHDWSYLVIYVKPLPILETKHEYVQVDSLPSSRRDCEDLYSEVNIGSQSQKEMLLTVLLTRIDMKRKMLRELERESRENNAEDIAPVNRIKMES